MTIITTIIATVFLLLLLFIDVHLGHVEDFTIVKFHQNLDIIPHHLLRRHQNFMMITTIIVTVHLLMVIILEDRPLTGGILLLMALHHHHHHHQMIIIMIILQVMNKSKKTLTPTGDPAAVAVVKATKVVLKQKLIPQLM